mgnify:CR=1 FL=1
MAQSFSQIFVHAVFSTKKRYPFIKAEIESELFAYMGDSIKRLKGIPILINGIANHVHVFSTLPKLITVPKLIEELKRNSSRWIKSKGVSYQRFAWQNGYGAFSVSESQLRIVLQYIQRQKEHHKKRSFQEEFIEILEKHNIEYDPKYIWD